MSALHALLQQDPAAALVAAQQNDPGNDNEPGDTDFVIGAALFALGRDEESETSLRAALTKNPSHQDAGVALAHLLRKQGRYRAAATVTEASVAANPQDHPFALHAIVFLRECQQHKTAERIWEKAQPGTTAASNYLGGELAMALGDFAAARDRFDRCLARNPAHPGAITRRAHSGDTRQNEAFREHLRLLAEQRSNLRPQTLVALDFALGKLAMDRGEIGDAFVHFDRGNAAQRAMAPWDRKSWEAFVSARTQSADCIPSGSTRGDDIVLIIGLPRSGTTLLASRLGQHPEIAERGELPWLEMIDQPPITADTYLQHLHQDDAKRARYIDKNPLNFRYLDIVARDFPRARILHCRRDPRDTAISSYMQFFAHSALDWSCAWEDIVDFQRGYRRLIEQRPQGLAWLDIDYAELVAAPERTLRRAIDFIGLPWCDTVMATGASGTISTASVWQARQPMHVRSVGRWKSCAPHIAPLLAEYGHQTEPDAWFRSG